MNSPYFCDSCIERDFAKLADGILWVYGTVEELLLAADSETECRLCRLILESLGNSFLENEDWRPNWLIKLCPPVHLPLSESKPSSEIIAVVVQEPGYDRIDERLSGGRHPWATALLQWSLDLSLTGAIEVLQANDENKMSLAPPPRAHASDDECFRLIREWLTQCTKSHKNVCSPIKQAELPTRVLEVSPIGNKDNVRLVETKVSGNPTIGVYTALSYSWGRIPFLTTNKDNISDHKKSIRVDDCPLTVRDAIKVTRELHIPYLWVDSLCIIQGKDEVAQEDFKRESVKMSAVYSNAFVTIVAANTEQATNHFLKSRSEQMQSWVLLDRDKYYSQDEADFFRPGAKIARQEFIPSRFTEWRTTVDTRAWCLQEKVLSQRILSYHDEGLSLACHHSWAIEGYQHPWSKTRLLPWLSFGMSWKKRFAAGFRLLFDDEVLSRISLSKKKYQNTLWTNLIRQYTSRDISNESDKMVAIAGIAQAWQDNFGSCYLAGIWSTDIHRQLLWCHNGRKDVNGIRHFKVSSPRRSPSWSWASMNGEVTFHWRLGSVSATGPGRAYSDIKKTQYAKVEWVSCNLRPHGSRTWSGSYLILEAPVHQSFNVIQVDIEDLKESCGTFFDTGAPPANQALHYVELVHYKAESWEDDEWVRLSSGLVLVEVTPGALDDLLSSTEEDQAAREQQNYGKALRDSKGRQMASRNKGQIYTNTGVLELDLIKKRDSDLPQYERVGVYKGLDMFSTKEERKSHKILVR